MTLEATSWPLEVRHIPYFEYSILTFNTVDPATPRDGTKRNPDQQDTTRFKGDAADTFGETLAGGDNDPETQLPAMVKAGTMPQVNPGGTVMMTIHQVNGDGAGMSPWISPAMLPH